MATELFTFKVVSGSYIFQLTFLEKTEPSEVKQQPAQESVTMAGRKRSRKMNNRETAPEPARKGASELERKIPGPEDHQGKRSGKRSRKRKWQQQESLVEKRKTSGSKERALHGDQQRPGDNGKRRKEDKKRRWRHEGSIIFPKRKRAAVEAETLADDQPMPGPSSASPACPEDTSNTIKRFNFKHQIGRGGFGVVLLAYDTITMKEVAIKVQNIRGMSEREEAEALEEMTVLQATSGSPFLVHSILTFRTENNLAFVMEYASGGDLFDLLVRRGRLEVQAVTFYAAEIVSGLQYLHAKGFIHRDIKPENILIDGSGHIKIADFGLAVNKIQGAVGYAGTRGYIAPEIVSSQQYDAGVDWYSFGVVLFNMTSGQFPHDLKISALSGCDLSPIMRDIIEELLCDDPQMRLGVNGEIRHHPFFEGIDWVELEDLRVQPPFIPDKPPMKVPSLPQMLEE